MNKNSVLPVLSILFFIAIPALSWATDPAPEEGLEMHVTSIEDEETAVVGTNEIVFKSGSRYQLAAEPKTDEQKRIYESLTEEQRAKFQEVRRSLIGKIFSEVDGRRKLTGRMLITKDKVIKFTLKHYYKTKTNLGRMSLFFAGSDQWRTWESNYLDEPIEDTPPEPLEIAGEQLQKFINDFDQILWNSCKALSRDDLLSRSLMVGGEFSAGLGKVGAALGYTFHFRYIYDKKSQKSYFEIAKLKVTYKRAITYSLAAKLNAKISWFERVTMNENRWRKSSMEMYTLPAPLPSIYIGEDDIIFANSFVGVDPLDVLLFFIPTFTEAYISKVDSSSIRFNADKVLGPLQKAGRFLAPSARAGLRAAQRTGLFLMGSEAWRYWGATDSDESDGLTCRDLYTAR